VLEKFCTDISYEKRIENIDSKSVFEDQLSKFMCAIKCRDGKEYHASLIKNCMAAIWCHLNKKLGLVKSVNILNPKIFYKFNTVINGKIKTLSYAGLGKCNSADSLIINEVEQILEHPMI
ncbi:3245_t:CDS:1, partial [Cetraspora pellucida]